MTIADLFKLPAPERIRLARELLQSVEEENQPIPEETKTYLSDRKARYESGEPMLTLEELKAKFKGKYGSV
ncbi:MAG: addiction module protein [Bacteroidota bacterium]